MPYGRFCSRANHTPSRPSLEPAYTYLGPMWARGSTSSGRHPPGPPAECSPAISPRVRALALRAGALIAGPRARGNRGEALDRAGRCLPRAGGFHTIWWAISLSKWNLLGAKAYP